MRSTVSVRWQTVIPQEVREALGIEPNSKLEWEVTNGHIVVHPLPANPVRAARGMFKGAGPSVEDLLAERRRERDREEEGTDDLGARQGS
jgi:AbrB family looped-hinge helix DNA binding protein